MPEYPEVNLQIRYLRERAIGAAVETYSFKGKRQFKAHRQAGDEAAKATLDAFLIGNTIDAITQRGKHIIVKTDRGLLTSHLMLKGRWSFEDDHFISNYRRHREPPPDWARGLTLTMQDGRALTLYTPAWQASASIHPGVHDPAALPKLSKLGPESIIVEETDPAFAATPWSIAHLARSASRSGKAIKLVMLDQKQVAGLGNVLVCEALYHARVHPERPARSLTPEEIEALHRASVAITQKAIDTDLDYDSFLNVYRREEDREGRPVTMIKVGQRDTFFVEALQPQP